MSKNFISLIELERYVIGEVTEQEKIRLEALIKNNKTLEKKMVLNMVTLLSM